MPGVSLDLETARMALSIASNSTRAWRRSGIRIRWLWTGRLCAAVGGEGRRRRRTRRKDAENGACARGTWSLPAAASRYATPRPPPAPWHAQDSGGGGCGSNLMLPYSMSDWRISVLSAPSGTARTWTTFDGGGCSGEGAWVVVGGEGAQHTRVGGRRARWRRQQPVRRARRAAAGRAPGGGRAAAHSEGRVLRPPGQLAAPRARSTVWRGWRNKGKGGVGGQPGTILRARHTDSRAGAEPHTGGRALWTLVHRSSREASVLCRKPVRGVRERASAEPHR